MTLVVRFNEYTRYDINQDCEVVCFNGITNQGSYYKEMPVGTSRQLRESRNAFRERVCEMMERGQPPCEVSLA